ncbi:MAG TPA: AarF/UbiB family protein [Terriglobia bacterium]|jgi:predicted unusual protein kinase regulating ubiquinone biosynthesis (AarF/ABC1/UbiB family)
MILRIFVVWYRLSPFLLAFLRDRRRWILAGPPRFQSDDAHRARARRLTRTIASLGPSFIKLAQVFGIRADIVPPIYVEEFANLHDRVPPFPTPEVRKRIESELKQRIDDVFESFQGEALAAASLGQVHRARYRGQEVIVKVLRPGVEELVATDIRVVQNLVFILEQFIDHHIIRSTRTIIDEFSRVIAEEMDFLHEADNVERFAELYRDSSFVIIPKVYREVTTTRVLVMEFCEGFRIDETQEIVRHKIDTRKMIENLIEFYGGQLLIHGLFHADPHPGNILVQPDARIVLLDYGMVVEITPEFRQELVRAVIAAVRSDVDGVIDAAYKLDMLETDVSPSTLSEAAHSIISIHLDKRLTQRQIQELSFHIVNTFYRFPLRLPSNLVYILRTAVLIEGLGIAYDPHFNSLTTAIPIYKKILERSLGPSVWPTVKDTITKEGLALYTLLKDMENVFARAGREQLRIRIHPADMDGLEKFISHLFRRVVMTISGVGLAVVTSILYLKIGSLLLLALGLLFSFWLITLVFLLPNPQRYPFRVRRARKAGRIL